MQCIYQAKNKSITIGTQPSPSIGCQEGELPRMENVEKRMVQIKLTGVLYVTFFFFKKKQWDHKLHNFHTATMNNINCYMRSGRKSLGIV